MYVVILGRGTEVAVVVISSLRKPQKPLKVVDNESRERAVIALSDEASPHCTPDARNYEL